MRAINTILKIVLGLVLILSLFLVSCGSGEEQLTGSAVAEPAAKIEKIAPQTPEPEYDPVVAELKEKSQGITNYQYLFQSSLWKRGSYLLEPVYQAYIKEDKAKKAYLVPVKFSDGNFYSKIYLIGGKALGICDTSDYPMTCDKQGMAYEVDYAEAKLKMTPQQLVQAVPVTAKKTGEETFDNRRAVILEYDEGGKKVKLSVDKYYGLAIKKIVYGYEDDLEIELEKYYFMELAVGGVKNRDVEPG